MNTQTIFMCVVALLIGMLVANMLQNVCGCKKVEGFVNKNKSGTSNRGVAPILPSGIDDIFNLSPENPYNICGGFYESPEIYSPATDQFEAGDLMSDSCEQIIGGATPKDVWTSVKATFMGDNSSDDMNCDFNDKSTLDQFDSSWCRENGY